MKDNHTKETNKLITKALIYKQKGDLINAEIALKKALKLEPGNFIVLNNIGNIYSAKNDQEKAKNFFLKAIKIKGDYGNAIFNLALINEEVGNKKEAVELYKKAIDCDPDNLSFYYNLSRIDNDFFSSNKIENVKKILKKGENSNFGKASGFFILAEDQRKKVNLEKELEYLTEAHKYFHFSNEKINNQVSFYWIRLMPKIIKQFSFSCEKDVLKNIKPIFIMGLPRSGSTLVESILCSGKKIIPNGGETAIINRIFLECSKKFLLEKGFLDNNKKLVINEKLFIQKALKQYKLINLLGKNKDNIFTDKSLENFFYIELIVKFFPSCKIIICKRNILQIIISIYQNFLPKIKWSHSIDNILEYIDNYLKIIDNIKKNYSDKVYMVELEELTKDPVNLSKDLFNFCNLEWDKKCLEFYSREDLVSKTASNQQVRSKIFNNNPKKHPFYKELFSSYLNKYEWLKEVL
jgi:tetratricopeptide (TPR) repeat protein